MLNVLRVSQLVLIPDSFINSCFLIHIDTFVVIELWELMFTVFLNKLAYYAFANIQVLCMLFIEKFQTGILKKVVKILLTLKISAQAPL